MCEPDYPGAGGSAGAGPAPGRTVVVVVIGVPERFGTGTPGDVTGVCVTVVGWSGPGPSGSTTVVATWGPLVVGTVASVPLVVAVGLDVSDRVVSVLLLDSVFGGVL